MDMLLRSRTMRLPVHANADRDGIEPGQQFILLPYVEANTYMCMAALGLDARKVIKTRRLL